MLAESTFNLSQFDTDKFKNHIEQSVSKLGIDCYPDTIWVNNDKCNTENPINGLLYSKVGLKTSPDGKMTGIVYIGDLTDTISMFLTIWDDSRES